MKSTLKTPLSRYENGHQVNEYYLRGEHYDWVQDPRGLERLFHRNRQRIIGDMLREAGPKVSGLDMGCGTGLITGLIPAHILVAVDINRWNLERARERVRAEYLQCELSRLPFQNGMFDLIVCTEVIEHTPRPIGAMREARRVLDENGLMVGSVPSRSWLWKLRSVLSRTHRHQEPFHRNYSIHRLARLLALFFNTRLIRTSNYGMNLFFLAENR